MVKVIRSISGGVSICFCSQSSIAHSLCESYDTLLRRVGASDTIDDSNEQRAISTHARIMIQHCQLRLRCLPLPTPDAAAKKKTPCLNALTLHTLPPSSLPQASPLLRLRFRITRFLQCGETFGFDGLARLLLLGAHGVGLLKRGLQNVAKKSVNN